MKSIDSQKVSIAGDIEPLRGDERPPHKHHRDRVLQDVIVQVPQQPERDQAQPQADDDPQAGDPDELDDPAGNGQRRLTPAGDGQQRPQQDQKQHDARAVVEEALALDERLEQPGSPGLLERRQHRDRIGRRQHRPKEKRRQPDAPRSGHRLRQKQPDHQPDGDHAHQHAGDGQDGHRHRLALEVLQVDVQPRLKKQRRQEEHQDQLLGDLHLPRQILAELSHDKPRHDQGDRVGDSHELGQDPDRRGEAQQGHETRHRVGDQPVLTD
jgi:hypothetical protein